MKKLTSIAVVERPTINESTSFVKFNNNMVESLKTMERFEYSRVLEVGSRCEEINDNIFKPIIDSIILGNKQTIIICSDKLDSIIDGLASLVCTHYQMSAMAKVLTVRNELLVSAADEDEAEPEEPAVLMQADLAAKLKRYTSQEHSIVKLALSRFDKKANRHLRHSLNLWTVREPLGLKLVDLYDTYATVRDSKKIPADLKLVLDEIMVGLPHCTAITYVPASSSLKDQLDLVRCTAKKCIRLASEQVVATLNETCVSISNIGRVLGCLNSTVSHQDAQLQQLASELEAVSALHCATTDSMKQESGALESCEQGYSKVCATIHQVSREIHECVAEVKAFDLHISACKPALDAEAAQLTAHKARFETIKQKVQAIDSQLTARKKHLAEVDRECTREQNTNQKLEQDIWSKRKEIEDTPQAQARQSSDEHDFCMKEIDHTSKLMDIDSKINNLMLLIKQQELDNHHRRLAIEEARVRVAALEAVQPDLCDFEERHQLQYMKRRYGLMKRHYDAVHDLDSQMHGHKKQVRQYLDYLHAQFQLNL